MSEFVKESVEGADGVILSDYGKGLLTRNLIRTMIQRAKAAKKFVMVDPKLKNFFFYKGSTVVTPNTAEASSVLGIPITDLVSLNRVETILLKRLGCHVLVITRGEEGMAIFEPHQQPLLVPAVAKEVLMSPARGIPLLGRWSLLWRPERKSKMRRNSRITQPELWLEREEPLR
jgi:rfaE bifunctional protein kinase chain/domain